MGVVDNFFTSGGVGYLHSYKRIDTLIAVRLKRLEMVGFKSFADKTRVELEPGITAVVGPNGCGKSNIADAVRWALGEMSAKSLRSQHMMDVIFNGTANRAPLGMAEVSLTFDNTTHQLPIDYAEVTV